MVTGMYQVLYSTLTATNSTECLMLHLLLLQEKKILHSPGIEPGTSAWKADILPLNYECSLQASLLYR